MSEDSITIKLPSGKDAVIRNYTTRADDNAAEYVLLKDVNTNESGEVSIPLLNTKLKHNLLVERLTVSIDGKPASREVLDDLRTSDYTMIKDTVLKIVEDNSPKV